MEVSDYNEQSKPAEKLSKQSSVLGKEELDDINDRVNVSQTPSDPNYSKTEKFALAPLDIDQK